jgi:dihydroorotate dehydrogenase (fumarate)
MDLSTTYMGLKLKHPIVPSASPLSNSLDKIKLLEEAGASAIVMYSLFEEQIEHEANLLGHYLQQGAHSYAEALTYFPDFDTYNVEPDAYVNLIRRAKESVDIPIIGSLNGTSPGGWLKYARHIEQAGADGLELNLYYLPTHTRVTGGHVEQRYVDVLRELKRTVKIPIAMKLTPYLSAPGDMVRRLAEAGADSVVLFNRFYQPDFDLDSLNVTPHLVLSSFYAIRLPLRWIAILYGRVNIDFGLTTGVHTHREVLKGLMAGAKVTMMASALMLNGADHIGVVLQNMCDWMEEHEYESVTQMRGSMSQLRVADPDAFERANYMKVLDSWHAPVLRERAKVIAAEE